MRTKAPITNSPLLRVEDLTVEHPVGRGRKLLAVSRVSFELAQGETLGLVGESGCGKSTLARAIMHLPRPTAGRVLLGGEDLSALSPRGLRALRSRFQMIFQDPVASLNPIRRVGESIEAPLRGLAPQVPVPFDAAQRRSRAEEMMVAVGLDPKLHYDRRPFQLSGGQCQRVSIARALICSPELLVCDEPVSSLDVLVQAQIINLLREVKKSYGLSMLFIAHDLAVVRNISDRVAVMYLGRFCELAPCDDIYHAPAHPYTRALLNAVPHPDPRRPLLPTGMLPGEVPSATEPYAGCCFRSRCPFAQPICTEVEPEMREIAPAHRVACHFPINSQRAEDSKGICPG